MSESPWLYLVLYALGSFGFWWIIGRSGISLRAREAVAARSPLLAELVECPGCCGFWHGTAVGVVVAYQAAHAVFAIAASGLLLGCVTTATNLIFFALIGPALDRLEGDK